MSRIPDTLAEDIDAGRCVALLGPGFTAEARRTRWTALLAQLAGEPEVREEARGYLRDLADRATPPDEHELDTAAQLLEDEIGRDRFVDRLSHALEADQGSATMQRRLLWLREIPFRAVVTTVFDPVLEGHLPSPELYREILRPRACRWWERGYWEQDRGALVVKLHGDLQSPEGRRQVVITTRDFRRRTYADTGYMTFLQGLLSTNTLLFMGFSYRDAWLNEVRARVLALFEHRRSQPPMAYAIFADAPPLVRHHFERHEGIQVLPFSAKDGDYSGFDRHLEAIWSRTAILPRFGRLLEGRRVLWVDAHPENNVSGLDFLRRATGQVGNESVHAVDIANTADEALARLAERPYDLVVTNWGEGDARDERERPLPTAVRVLTRMRREDVCCPVIVFSRAFDLRNRKATALSLGAQAYCFRWETLFRTIDRVFRPGSETG